MGDPLLELADGGKWERRVGARSARLLARLVAFLVFLQLRLVLFLLAKVGGARPAAFGRPRVIAEALALLRLGGLLLVLEVGFLEPQRRPALLGLDRAAAGFAVIAVDGADTGHGTGLSFSRERHQRPLVHGG
tara:strand:+ start:375 stop:773 length:399 start_codon:yes stop_codon:yes gene_type:complete